MAANVQYFTTISQMQNMNTVCFANTKHRYKKKNTMCFANTRNKQTGSTNVKNANEQADFLTGELSTKTAGGAKAHVAGVDRKDSWTECFGEPPSPLPFTHVYSGFLTLKWLAALCSRATSCLCYFLDLPFSYALIDSLTRMPVCT